MSLYREGYAQALQWVKEQTDVNKLLWYIDGLQGRDNIEDEDDLEEVRSEAIEQCRQEFLDTSSSEYSQVQFYLKATKLIGEIFDCGDRPSI